MATLGARLAPRTAAASPRSPARARPQRVARAASRRALCAAKQALLSVSDKAGVAELAQVRAPQLSRAWPIDHRLHPMPSGGGTTLIAAAGAAVTLQIVAQIVAAQIVVDGATCADRHASGSARRALHGLRSAPAPVPVARLPNWRHTTE